MLTQADKHTNKKKEDEEEKENLMIYSIKQVLFKEN